MNKAKMKFSIICLVVGCLLLTQMAYAEPYFRLDTQHDWEYAITEGKILPMENTEWSAYMSQWSMYREEGPPYPPTTFRSPHPPTGELYVYGGGGGGGGGALDPCDAGLVMYWGSPPDGNYSSAWKFDYQLDPDLSNCIITVTVTAPVFSPATNAQITQVSFGLQNNPNLGGPIRAWYWNCGAAGSGAPIIWNTPTTITIDTSKVGVAAATPVATAYMNNPGFNIKQVQWLLVDENGNWVNGGTPAPAPGSPMTGLWNYWHWLMVSPKTTLSKGYYPKWNQPPVIVDTNLPPTILGWDEMSDFEMGPIVADDWECNDTRPITDIHWWGSFIGWNQPHLPPVVPQAFHIGIWTDVPDPNLWAPMDFSHPGTLVWENYCDNYVWNFAGYDKDPRQQGGPGEPCDSCFQFNQLLSQDEWFYQEPNLADPCHPQPRIYWLSIAPIWPPGVPPYHWGWKTRPHYFNDDAVVIQGANSWPPVVGTTWLIGYPIKWPPYPNPEGISWDVSFELTTNEPGPEPNEPPDFDVNNDGIVNFIDFAEFAKWWLTPGP
jgi:hypothetical protein